jgi:O-antigen/teichoic acid export membrane protein
LETGVQPSLKKRAIRGTAITLGGQVATQVLRLGSNLILTRLLFPGAFALMALVTVVMIGLEMLSDLGVRISIIQNKRAEERAFLDTAWTISLIRGAVLFVVGTLIAWPYSVFYEDPVLFPMIAVTCLTAFISGATSTKLALLYRHMHLGRVAVINLSSHIAGIIVMIAYAAITRSLWALVVGNMVASVVTFLFAQVWLPGPRDRLRWDAECAREILTFGKWIFVSTVITFFANNLHTLLLGKLVTKDVLGVYNIGGQIAQIPAIVGGQIIGNVLLPALSAAFREDHSTLVSTFDRARSAILLTGGYICLGGALLAPAFFTLLYDPRYHDAGWMAQLLMLTSWFSFLQEVSSRALQAMGDARSLVSANGARLVVTAAGSIAGHVFAGLPGFIVGSAIGALAGHAVITVMLHRQKIPAGWTDVRYSFALIAGALVVVIGAGMISARTGVDRIALMTGVSILILAPMGLSVGKRMLAEIRAK